jgi:uncharacterized protein
MTETTLSTNVLLLCLALGGGAGLLGGLIGIGGGFVLIPGLFFLFSHFYSLDSSHAIRFALGTTMACILITSAMATLSHRKYKVILWPFFKSLTPSIIVGVCFGVYLASHIDVAYVKIAFASFCVYSGIRMLFIRPKTSEVAPQTPSVSSITPAGAFFGTLCGTIGVGGANLIVPFLLKRGAQMREAMATASALQIPIALTGLISYIITGLGIKSPELSQTLGYVSLPIMLAVGISIALFTPIGVKLSHALPVNLLKRMFGLVALGIGLHMSGLFTLQLSSEALAKPAKAVGSAKANINPEAYGSSVDKTDLYNNSSSLDKSKANPATD